MLLPPFVVLFWQKLLPTMGVDGRWNCHWVNTLILIVMFCAGPHPIYEAAGTCLYFYLGDGSLTLMTRGSLIALVRFWSSLPIIVTVINGNFMTWDVTMVMNGRGRLLMLLEPFCKSSCRLFNVFIFTPIFTTFVFVN